MKMAETDEENISEEEEGTELELEALYRRYCVRLKHALFVSALCVTLLCIVTLLCAVCILHLHELGTQTMSIASLSVITFVLSIVLCLALLPVAPEWEAFALAGSLLVTLSLGAGTLLATLHARHHAPLPLFALILMVHTMMPIARSIALGMSAVLTLAYTGLALGGRTEGEETLFYQQVRGRSFLGRLATRNLDVIWNRKSNPEPWKDYKAKQYKFYSPNIDYSKEHSPAPKY